jgi:hypothetical protein
MLIGASQGLCVTAGGQTEPRNVCLGLIREDLGKPSVRADQVLVTALLDDGTVIEDVLGELDLTAY